MNFLVCLVCYSSIGYLCHMAFAREHPDDVWVSMVFWPILVLAGFVGMFRWLWKEIFGGKK